MNDNVVIKVDHLHKHFMLPHERSNSLKSAILGMLKGKRGRTVEKQQALKDINFEIKKGEFFGIVGRNGSGKSTLLKLLAQIYQPNKGTLKVNGRLVPFIELGVGFNPELTGRENVYLSASLLGFSRREIDAMYNDVVSFAELEKFMDQKLKNYSSGMQVRLAFSVAVQAKADILLIDEVLAVGDADFQRKCFEYFISLKSTETTVVFVSHDMAAVREYCTRALLIEDGKIVDIGNTDKVAEQYSRLFMGDQTIERDVKGAVEDRWGDGAAKIKKATVEVTEKSIVFTEVVQFLKPMENPVAGIRIRNNGAKDIAGTNTHLTKTKLGSFKPKDEITLRWELPNVLSDGVYWFDPTIQYADAVTVADWWNKAAQFKVRKEFRLAYPLDPGIKVKVIDQAKN